MSIATEAVKKSEVFEINGMNLWYGEHQALKDIHMKMNKHEVTAIIGPSGCGKSTFIKTLNLMIRMTPNVRMTGDMIYNGSNLLQQKVDVVELRKNIGMVFQKGNPFPQSIFDNVAYGPRIHGMKNKKKLQETVEKSLKDVALWDEVKDRLHHQALALSGGQQQRLCIARALATNPDILLMDEPTSALDPISTRKIEEFILQLKGKYTIVIVTHNMQQAARVSDQTAFFYMGELVECDDTVKMFSHPNDKRTKDYITGKFG
ncbi:phosphate ABC transporter ATP-binding protein PstB [Bacillus atrophaeus]|uniref:phosphate ABC transporter ATP-binding protein PstB n=1 Tax=Bacillus atrophaeus TaxID=1452 RepID=UPI002281CE26|nr:phosphate ABC transporter ATP-binding protein PstB [Bacillus atrophaeus]MCY8909599.1 phosphate ABC transporter ATP-binding protein PstB [Bacillus atrophaeus]MEC0837616.1 phosphate ABC transporter ATP-binding protein PstB [Bacillus atrophaeus]MEC0845417.1 phosphate ABC transporter ATP-binding protein PstB [Bacillus atrophaeus]MEC0851377.1 phosphate ABC transporter ATP-binding protein PstB [Bacillus atrophaeus]MEC0867528.1 phosphate ABC transporter ATP-binding protein PstB [Bacillus atrophaeu